MQTTGVNLKQVGREGQAKVVAVRSTSTAIVILPTLAAVAHC